MWPERSERDNQLQDTIPQHCEQNQQQADDLNEFYCCDCSGVIQIPGHHHLPGREAGQSHWIDCEKGPAEGCTSFASWGSSTCHRSCWNSSTLPSLNNCLVQISYQIWPQKTTEGSPDCWASHWYNPPHSPRTVTKGLLKSLWTPHIQHTFELLPSGRRYRALSTRTTRHRNSFFPQAIISWTHDNNYGTLFTFMHLADAFIQSDLQRIHAIHIFVSTCVPWESNPQPLRC